MFAKPPLLLYRVDRSFRSIPGDRESMHRLDSTQSPPCECVQTDHSSAKVWNLRNSWTTTGLRRLANARSSRDGLHIGTPHSASTATRRRTIGVSCWQAASEALPLASQLDAWVGRHITIPLQLEAARE